MGGLSAKRMDCGRRPLRGSFADRSARHTGGVSFETSSCLQGDAAGAGMGRCFQARREISFPIGLQAMRTAILLLGLLATLSFANAADVEAGHSAYVIHDGQPLLADKDP